ncbi:MAG: Mth938-like domain-containing protein [Burkholderiales bacterium]|nr:Mth938-like domain-containing protein [Burkholderiales bacterium]
MKIHADAPNVNTITAYGPGWVEVNRERFSESLIVSAMGDRLPWNCPGFDDLQLSHFQRIIDLDPELVMFGSGARIRFAQAPWVAALHARGIGLDTMDTQAACRAYNFLAGEGRRVVAALLL